MLDRDWLAEEGRCIPCKTDEHEDWSDVRPYRLYRFLTDVEDIVDRESDDRLRLQQENQPDCYFCCDLRLEWDADLG